MGKFPGVKTWVNEKKIYFESTNIIIERAKNEPVPNLNVYDVQLKDCTESDGTTFPLETESLREKVLIHENTADEISATLVGFGFVDKSLKVATSPDFVEALHEL